MSSELSVGNGEGSFEGMCEVTESSLRVVVNNVSKLENRICSPRPLVVLRGIPFRVLVEPIVDKVKRHTSLGVFLQCDYKNTEEWSCKVKANFTLIAHKKDCNNIDFTFQYTFRQNSSTSWGFPSFLIWSKLVDPLLGFVKDDSCVLEIKVQADPPNGVQRRKLHDMELFLKPKNNTELKTTLPLVKSEDEDQGESDEEEEEEGEDEEEEEDEENNPTDLKTSNEKEKVIPVVIPSTDPDSKILELKNEVGRSPAQEEKLRRALVASILARRNKRARSKSTEQDELPDWVKQMMKANLNYPTTKEESFVETKQETMDTKEMESTKSLDHGTSNVADVVLPSTDTELKEAMLPIQDLEDHFVLHDEDSRSSSDGGFEYLA